MQLIEIPSSHPFPSLYSYLPFIYGIASVEACSWFYITSDGSYYEAWIISSSLR